MKKIILNTISIVFLLVLINGVNVYALKATDVDADYFKAVRLLENGRYNEAELCLKRAIAVTPEKFHYYITLGVIFQAQGNVAEARHAYLTALEKHPHAAIALFNLGVVAMIEGNFPEAYTYFDQAMLYDPSLEEEAEPLLCKAYIRGRNIDRLARVIQVEQSSATALRDMAYGFYARFKVDENADDLNKARFYAEKAIDRDILYGPAHMLLAKILYEIGNDSRAHDEIITTLELLNPKTDPEMIVKAKRLMDKIEKKQE